MECAFPCVKIEDGEGGGREDGVEVGGVEVFGGRRGS